MSAGGEVRIPDEQADYWTRYFASSRARSHIGARRRREALRACPDMAGKNLLDVGCGSGASTVAAGLAGARRPLGLDLNPDLPRRGPRIAAFNAVDARYVLGDATRLPFGDGGFDRVLSMEMLEHIPDWEGCVREMARAVKPGGTLVLSTPNKWGIHHMLKMIANRFRLQPRGHHYTFERFLSRRQVRRVIEESGLGPVEVHTVLFMMPFVPDRLFRPCLALEKVFEGIPFIRGLGVTNIYRANKPA